MTYFIKGTRTGFKPKEGMLLQQETRMRKEAFNKK